MGMGMGMGVGMSMGMGMGMGKEPERSLGQRRACSRIAKTWMCQRRKALEEVKLREQKEIEKLQLAKELAHQQLKKQELQARAHGRISASRRYLMTTSPIYQVELTRKSAYEAFLERVCELTEYFDDIENIIKRRRDMRRDMRRDRPLHLGEFVCAHLSANFLFGSCVFFSCVGQVRDARGGECRSAHARRRGAGRDPLLLLRPVVVAAGAAVVVTRFDVAQFSTEELSTKLSEFVR